ncbi:MAG TPA: TVP38/TMEM64 family protein [Oscillatoriales cyanobacterium M4454_W2019_049]|nr:TVP38/TMEM64 family protein [Oscillatoriales cyanobacterium M4454_W2019_049]
MLYLQKTSQKLVFRVMSLSAIALFSAVTPALAEEVSSKAGFNLQAIFQNALEWVNSQGTVGVLVFIGLYAIATVALVPGSLLTLGAGVIFGLAFGSIYVFVGATLGATLAFIVGRYLTRDWVAKKIEGNEKFAAIDRAVSKEGFKIVLLTRLSPAFPFVLLNYAYGLTGVTLKDYVLGSVGMIPGTIMYVYLGSLAGDLARIGMEGSASNPNAEIAQWVLRIVGFIATVAVTVYVTKIARQALNEETEN